MIPVKIIKDFFKDKFSPERLTSSSLNKNDEPALAEMVWNYA